MTPPIFIHLLNSLNVWVVLWSDILLDEGTPLSNTLNNVFCLVSISFEYYSPDYTYFRPPHFDNPHPIYTYIGICSHLPDVL